MDRGRWRVVVIAQERQAEGGFSDLVVAAFGRAADNSNDKLLELVVAAFGRAAGSRYIGRMGGGGI